MFLKEKLTERREDLQMGMKDVANLVGVRRSDVKDWEIGAKIPSKVQIGKLANVLKVTPGYLADDKEIKADRNISSSSQAIQDVSEKIEMAEKDIQKDNEISDLSFKSSGNQVQREAFSVLTVPEGLTILDLNGNIMNILQNAEAYCRIPDGHNDSDCRDLYAFSIMNGGVNNLYFIIVQMASNGNIRSLPSNFSDVCGVEECLSDFMNSHLINPGQKGYSTLYDALFDFAYDLFRSIFIVCNREISVANGKPVGGKELTSERISALSRAFDWFNRDSGFVGSCIMQYMKQLLEESRDYFFSSYVSSRRNAVAEEAAF